MDPQQVEHPNRNSQTTSTQSHISLTCGTGRPLSMSPRSNLSIMSLVFTVTWGSGSVVVEGAGFRQLDTGVCGDCALGSTI